MKLKSKEIIGSISVLLSALFFYLATAVIRQSTEQTVISPFLFILYRAGLGLLLVSLILLVKRKKPIAKEYKFLSLRVFGNLFAVLAFFKATLLGSAAKANILNLTYPLFIVLFLLIFSKGKKNYKAYFAAFTSFIGITLVVEIKDSSFFDLASLWGLSSGLLAAIAVIALAKTREKNDTDVVLFYMFLGAVLPVLIFVPEVRVFSSSSDLYYLLLSASYGAAGQLFFTFGFKFVSAEEGSILSSTRILIAAFMGPLITNDPGLTIYGYLGALLIFLSNAYVIKNKLNRL